MSASATQETSLTDGLQPIYKVLIGTSLDSVSHQNVRSCLSVVRALDARVHLLHVMLLEPMSFGTEAVGGTDILETLRSQREADLAEQVEETGILDSELLGAEVVAGSPHDALAATASTVGADLIMVGAEEGHCHGGELLGSTTDRLIRCARVPVLIVRNGLPLPPRRVLAPIDFSPTSALAVEAGVRFLLQIHADSTASIESLFVLSELSRQLAVNLSPQQVDRLAKEELLRFTFEHTSAWPGTIETRVRIGDARHQLQKELDEHPVDLVVVGSHGHGRIHRALIGSVAGQIARQAACSVLFVPQPEKEGVSDMADTDATRAEDLHHRVPASHEASPRPGPDPLRPALKTQ